CVFFIVPPPTELYPLSLHDALPIFARGDMIDDDALLAALHGRKIGGAFLDPTNPEPLPADHPLWSAPDCMITMHLSGRSGRGMRSEEHTSELQSRRDLVCRLLLEKK